MVQNKMTAPSNLSIKGKGENLVITSHHQEFSGFWIDFSHYLLENESFLQKAHIVLDTRDIPINSKEMFKVRDFLLEHQMTLVQINSTNTMTNITAGLLGIRLFDVNQASKSEQKLGSKSSDRAVILRKTIRSGTVIDESCDVIIMGDVNPGAVIRSDGSIIVWGKLQGEVHAGRSGNVKSLVCALELNTTNIILPGINRIREETRPGSQKLLTCLKIQLK